jgi:alpha/beta hydrolase family protein
VLKIRAPREAMTSRDAVPRRRRRLLSRILLGLLAALLVVAAAGYAYAGRPAQPTDRAIAALATDATVTVEAGGWLAFRPADIQPTVGLVIYPGGLVDYRAYAPVARAIAARGYFVAVVPMPLNLAVLAPDRALDVISAHPEIHRWAVGGHSLGGSMAATFARGHPDLVQGLVLWASYPAQWDDLSRTDLAVVSAYGTSDGLATSQKIDASRALLPPSTEWLAIQGGNHAQFGSYGVQSGDNPASIGEAEQQAEVATATADLLERVGRSDVGAAGR